LLTFVVVAVSGWWVAVNLSNRAFWDLNRLMWLIRIATCLLLFIALHYEIVRYFMNGVSYLTKDSSLNVNWQQYLSGVVAPSVGVLVASLCIVLALRIRSSALHTAAIIAIAVGTILWFVNGFYFAPHEYYTPILNARVITGFVLIAALVLTYRMRKGIADEKLRLAQRWLAGLALLLVTFELSSLEAVWSTYVQLQRIDFSGNTYVSYEHVHALWNQFHLILSGTWIGYGSVLLVIGFIRRLQIVRITAMGLLGLSILKVFLYDLSFLGQPYRIVSFIVLGLILIGASYMYARFRNSIFGVNDDAKDPSQAP